MDTGAVNKTPPTPCITTGPQPGEPVELVDSSVGRPLRAVVESVEHASYAVRYHSASGLRGPTRLRWFDGNEAWATAVAVHAGPRLDRADVEILEAFEPVLARGSERVAVDRFPLLVEIVHSGATAKGRRFDLLCHDVSATGCFARFAGRGPAAGDLVRVAWVRGDEWARVPPEWIDAVVTRAETRPFGGGQVGLRFDAGDDIAVSRVIAWRDAWAQEARAARRVAELSGRSAVGVGADYNAV
jgi:hypothetical protein